MDKPTEDSLITLNEADKIVEEPAVDAATYSQLLRIVSWVLLGVLVVMFLMVLVSLRGVKSGLGGVLPNLDKKTPEALQLK